MSKDIEPRLKKIGEYVKLEKNVLFSIPQYQRSYSWTVDNCDKLWQDISNHIEKKDQEDSYFFGTIIINCQDREKKYSIVDGQQRTTTFLLLLKALLIRINGAIKDTSKDEDSIGLCRGLKQHRITIMNILYRLDVEDISEEADEMDKERCKHTNILENQSINEIKEYRRDFHTIMSAVTFEDAKSNVYTIKYGRLDNKYTNYFRNFKFFYEKADGLSDSELNQFTKCLIKECEIIEIKSWQIDQAINMFNSLNSDGLPLYDADIISAQLFAVAEKKGNEDEFSKLWKNIVKNIEELDKNDIVTIDDILTQHMYHERAVNGEIRSESGSIILTTPGLRRYYIELNKKMLETPIQLCNNISHLVECWQTTSLSTIMRILLKFNNNFKLFIASFFYRFKPKEIIAETTDDIGLCLLRLFAVLEIVDVGYSSKYFKTFLFEHNKDIADSNITVDDIRSQFDNHINKNWTQKELKDLMKEYDGTALVYLNEYLFSIEKNVSFTLCNDYDIEHIMPNSGYKANLSEIRKDAGISSEEEFANYVDKLGNKIILEQKINRRIGNEWFRSKVSNSISDKKGYKDSKYPIATDLVKTYGSKEKPFWTKNDITDATNKAVERIVKFIFGVKVE